ncbi:MAG: hypothetical protein Kow00114_27440 [Kiloniellaceae bacterium]
MPPHDVIDPGRHAEAALHDFVRRLAIRMADRDHEAEQAAQAQARGTGNAQPQPRRDLRAL